MVIVGAPVDVARLLVARGYWNPPPHERNPALVDVTLPRARRYIEAHAEHGLIYLEDMIFNPDG